MGVVPANNLVQQTTNADFFFLNAVVTLKFNFLIKSVVYRRLLLLTKALCVIVINRSTACCQYQ